MSASSLPLPQGKSVSLKQFVSRHINEIGLLVVIAILYLVFSLNAPGFISLNNQMNVLRDAATIGIAAWAMTLIIISGEIDVSVGPMVAFVSVCLAFLLQFEVPLAVACLLVLLLGALMGTLAGVLRGTDIMVISDEIYAELTYTGKRHCSIATLEGMRERTIVVNGFSKSHAMTGWRLGYVCGPQPVISQMAKIHQYAIMCAPTTSQYAGIEAMRN